jgi:hypothetical protein
MAKLINEEEPDFHLTPFSPQRFATIQASS